MIALLSKLFGHRINEPLSIDEQTREYWLDALAKDKAARQARYETQDYAKRRAAALKTTRNG